MIRTVIFVLLYLTISSSGISQIIHDIKGSSTIYGLEDQLYCYAESVELDRQNAQLTISNQRKNIIFPFDDSSKVFFFQKALINNTEAYSLLVTNANYEFVAEIQFSKEQDGKDFVTILNSLKSDNESLFTAHDY